MPSAALQSNHPTTEPTTDTASPVSTSRGNAREGFHPLDDGGGIDFSSSLGSRDELQREHRPPQTIVTPAPLSPSPSSASTNVDSHPAHVDTSQLSSLLSRGNMSHIQAELTRLLEAGHGSEAAQAVRVFLEDGRTSANTATRILGACETPPLSTLFSRDELNSVRGAALVNYIDNNRADDALRLQSRLAEAGGLRALELALGEGCSRATASTDLVLRLFNNFPEAALNPRDPRRRVDPQQLLEDIIIYRATRHLSGEGQSARAAGPSGVAETLRLIAPLMRGNEALTERVQQRLTELSTRQDLLTNFPTEGHRQRYQGQLAQLAGRL